MSRSASSTRRIAVLAAFALAACGAEAPRTADGTASTDTAPQAVAAAPATQTAPAADTSSYPETARLALPNGTLTVEEPDTPLYHPSRVKVNGRIVLADSFSLGLEVHRHWARTPGGRGGPAGSTVLVARPNAGNACPAEFFVVELVSADSVAVTESFGSCAERPDSAWFDADGSLRMRFGDVPGIASRMDSTWVPGPPTTWIYRGGGRLEEVKGR